VKQQLTEEEEKSRKEKHPGTNTIYSNPSKIERKTLDFNFCSG